MRSLRPVVDLQVTVPEYNKPTKALMYTRDRERPDSINLNFPDPACRGVS